MCGRFTLHHTLEQVADRFAVQEVLFDFEPRFNIAPSQDIPVITQNGARVLNGFRWGLVPFWAKDPAIGNKMINARSETLAEKASFKYALTKRRCLIPADGFYEWKTDGKSRVPMYIRRQDEALYAFAGLWEEWTPPDQKDKPNPQKLRTCTIVTTTPNSLISQLHHRMAVILRPEDEAAWLDPSLQSVPDILQLLQPIASEELQFYPVSRRVNSPAHDAPDCIRPAEEEERDVQGALFEVDEAHEDEDEGV